MVNAAIVVHIAVIACNTIFQFFTVRAEFLLKWRNQIHICSGNASSATSMVSTWEKIIQFGIMILDTLKGDSKTDFLPEVFPKLLKRSLVFRARVVVEPFSLKLKSIATSFESNISNDNL